MREVGSMDLIDKLRSRVITVYKKYSGLGIAMLFQTQPIRVMGCDV